MTLLLNLLWALLGGGLVTALEYAVVGLILCLSVIGIPFGLQCFKMARLALMPFGQHFFAPSPTWLGLLGNALWLLLAGLWIFLTHLGLALSLALTIIGIPFALQHLKLAVLALAPFDVRLES